MFWVSFIIQDKGDTKPWLCAISTAQDTLEQAKNVIEYKRNIYNILSAWIDIFDENDNKQTVFHECYMR